MAKRRLSPKQLAAQRRFAAAARARTFRKKGKPTQARKLNTMPKRRTRSTSRIARVYRRAKSTGIGRRVRGKALLAGAVAGGIAPYSTLVAGDYGPGLTMVTAGIVADNEALQTMGGVSLGARLIQGMTASAGPLAAPGNANFI